ncbi:MAG TPA: hypothetical protein VF800_02605 [Telluria sp.]|jgi:hypothetical protein
MIETLQSLYAGAAVLHFRRIYLSAMVEYLIRDDRLGGPSQLARQYFAGHVPETPQARRAKTQK